VSCNKIVYSVFPPQNRRPESCWICWKDDKSLFPSRPESPRQYPIQLIKRLQLWHRVSPLEDRKLLAKSEVFKKEPEMNAEATKKCVY
jgi:hypothetical protein